MAITQDWQMELGGVTIGAGTDYALAGRVAGLGVAPIRQTDVRRNLEHGVASPSDRYEKRVVLIPVAIRSAGTAANANQLLTTLRNAWSAQSADVALDFRFPGTPETVMTVFGRPRGVDVTYDPELFPSATILATCTFEALDPLLYGAEQSDNNNTGTFSITNDGNEATRRVTITVTADGGGAPSLQNDTDAGDATLTWGSTLAASTVRVVDLYARTVEDSSGGTKVAELDAGSQFFSLEAGANSLVATNCSDVDVTWRDAWA